MITTLVTFSCLGLLLLLDSNSVNWKRVVTLLVSSKVVLALVPVIVQLWLCSICGFDAMI